MADASALAGETLGAIQTVQAFTLEDLNSRRFDDAVEDSFRAAVRRTKAQVAPELPPRTEDIILVDLDGEQRALYDAELKRARARRIEKVARWLLTVFSAMSMLSMMTLRSAVAVCFGLNTPTLSTRWILPVDLTRILSPFFTRP